MPGTIAACRLGMFVQAAAINLAPLLFVQLHAEFALGWERLGRLALINFLTQLAVDLAGAWLVARCGVRPLCVAAHILAAAGLIIFSGAAAGGGYATLVAGTLVYSAGCGLLEVLLSPIIDAVPSQRKAGDMALLHAFYPLGKLAVIVGTATAFAIASPAAWPWVACAWAAVPAAGAWLFARVELPALPTGAGGQRIGDLLRSWRFAAVALAMVLAGASELAIAQWTSAFAQRALGYGQEVADLVGFGLFAVGMAAGRLWYGLRGSGRDLPRLLAASAAAAAAVYLIAALAPLPWLALIACAAAGAAISILWPLTLSIGAARWPLAGAALFAALAAGGDGGAAIGPWAVGWVADAVAADPDAWRWLAANGGADAIGLRAGLLAGALAPLALIPLALALRSGMPERGRGP